MTAGGGDDANFNQLNEPVTLPIGNCYTSVSASNVVVQTDGVIINQQCRDNSSNAISRLVKYRNNGALDTGFSGGGVFEYFSDVSGFYDTKLLVIDIDDSIWVTGNWFNPMTQEPDIFLNHFSANGVEDVNYPVIFSDVQGANTYEFPTFISLEDFTNKIIISGYSDNSMIYSPFAIRVIP